MSRHRWPDAVCRTRSPESELLLVLAEPSNGTDISLTLVTPDGTLGTKTVRFATNHSATLKISLVFGLLSIHTNTHVLRRVSQHMIRLKNP